MLWNANIFLKNVFRTFLDSSILWKSNSEVLLFVLRFHWPQSTFPINQEFKAFLTFPIFLLGTDIRRHISLASFPSLLAFKDFLPVMACLLRCQPVSRGDLFFLQALTGLPLLICFQSSPTPEEVPKWNHILQTLQFLLQSLIRTDGTFYLQCFGEFLPYLNLRRRSIVFIVHLLILPSAASKSSLQGRPFQLHYIIWLQQVTISIPLSALEVHHGFWGNRNQCCPSWPGPGKRK